MIKKIMQAKKRSRFNYHKVGSNFRILYVSKCKVFMFKYIPIYTYKTQIIDFTNLKT